MKTITIEIPANLNLDAREAKLLFATRLFESGKATMGQAAEMVGLSKRAFMELLSLYGVSPFNYSPDELEQDLANVRNHHR